MLRHFSKRPIIPRTFQRRATVHLYTVHLYTGHLYSYFQYSNGALRVIYISVVINKIANISIAFAGSNKYQINISLNKGKKHSYILLNREYQSTAGIYKTPSWNFGKKKFKLSRKLTMSMNGTIKLRPKKRYCSPPFSI